MDYRKTMVQKLICAVLMSLLSPLLLAEGHLPYSRETILCDGYYVGVGVGVANLSNYTTLTGLTHSTERYGAIGFAAALQGGYSWNFGEYYNIGLEGFFNYTNIDTRILVATPSSTARYKTNYTIGMKLLPALQFTASTRIFAVVGFGWTWRKFYTSSASQSLANASASYVNTAASLVLGAGINTAVTDSISIRGEYDYIRPSNWGFNAAGTSTINAGFKESTNIAILSLNYNFC